MRKFQTEGNAIPVTIIGKILGANYMETYISGWNLSRTVHRPWNDSPASCTNKTFKIVIAAIIHTCSDHFKSTGPKFPMWSLNVFSSGWTERDRVYYYARTKRVTKKNSFCVRFVLEFRFRFQLGAKIVHDVTNVFISPADHVIRHLCRPYSSNYCFQTSNTNKTAACNKNNNLHKKKYIFSSKNNSVNELTMYT